MHLWLSPANTPTPGRATQPALAPWDTLELPASVDKALVDKARAWNASDGNFNQMRSIAAMINRSNVGRRLMAPPARLDRLAPQLESANIGLPALSLMLA